MNTKCRDKVNEYQMQFSNNEFISLEETRIQTSLVLSDKECSLTLLILESAVICQIASIVRVNLISPAQVCLRLDSV